eukprot:6058202-Pleurochrysis_carterae.AAC.1
MGEQQVRLHSRPLLPASTRRRCGPVGGGHANASKAKRGREDSVIRYGQNDHDNLRTFTY